MCAATSNLSDSVGTKVRGPCPLCLMGQRGDTPQGHPTAAHRAIPARGWAVFEITSHPSSANHDIS